MPRVVASIEARMSSSRLPGKVLADIGGKPLLTLLLNRLRAAASLDAVVLATSTASADDALASWAADNSVAVFRGSEDDVLARVVGAHRTMGSDVIVEVCGDTPMIDPELVDAAIGAYQAGGADVVTTTVKPSYPQGCDAQVFAFADLAEVARTVFDPAVREHVSLHFYENDARYRIRHLEAPASLRLPDQRLQVDYAEDLALVQAIHARLSPAYGDLYPLSAIVDLLSANPELARINKGCAEKAVR